MPRHVHDLDLERSQEEPLTVPEEAVKLAAIAADIGRAKNRPEDPLYLADVLADTDLGTRLKLDVGRAGQAIGGACVSSTQSIASWSAAATIKIVSADLADAFPVRWSKPSTGSTTAARLVTGSDTR
jgi:hypothetical protein